MMVTQWEYYHNIVDKNIDILKDNRIQINNTLTLLE